MSWFWNRLNFDNENFLFAFQFFAFYDSMFIFNVLLICIDSLQLNIISLFSLKFRCLATSAKLNEAPPKSSPKSGKAVAPNKSFVANFFRGKVESSETFPYPYYLTEEESETLSMVVDPVSRFFVVSISIFYWTNIFQNELNELFWWTLLFEFLGRERSSQKRRNREYWSKNLRRIMGSRWIFTSSTTR